MIQTREPIDMTQPQALATPWWKPTVVSEGVLPKKATEAPWTIPIITMEGAGEASLNEKPAKATTAGTPRGTLRWVKWCDRAEWVWDMTTNQWKEGLPSNLSRDLSQALELGNSN